MWSRQHRNGHGEPDPERAAAELDRTETRAERLGVRRAAIEANLVVDALSQRDALAALIQAALWRIDELGTGSSGYGVD